MFWAYMALGGMATIEIKIRCPHQKASRPTYCTEPGGLWADLRRVDDDFVPAAFGTAV